VTGFSAFGTFAAAGAYRSVRLSHEVGAGLFQVL
jgi:hypothetical protein